MNRIPYAFPRFAHSTRRPVGHDAPSLARLVLYWGVTPWGSPYECGSLLAVRGVPKSALRMHSA